NAPPNHQRRATDKSATLFTSPPVRRKWAPREPDGSGSHKPGVAAAGLSEPRRRVSGMPERDSWRGPLTAVLATAAGLWTVGVAALTAAVGWLAAETELELRSRAVPGWVWLVVAGAGAVLIGV